MIDQSHLQELQRAAGEVSVMAEGGVDLVFIPRLILPEGCIPRETPALLCTGQHGGYTTRLFLPAIIPGKGANWTQHVVLGKTWYTWSWNQVPAGLRPAEILAEHLRGLR
jgi:hypothetical protein